MTDILLDKTTGDICFTDGRFCLVTGTEAISQNIRIRFRMFYREWFLDERQGVPYARDVFVKNPDIDLIRALFFELLKTTAGVTTVLDLSVSVNPVTRELSGKFAVQTDTGAILTSEDFNPFILES